VGGVDVEMNIWTIIGLVLGGWIFNGVCYVVLDDVFEGFESGLARVHLGGLIRILALVPFSYMLVLCTLMALLLTVLLLASIAQTFVIAFKGLRCLIVGRR